MIKPIRFNPQDLLTQPLIDSHALAIQELQAIVGGNPHDHRDIEQTLVYIENYSDHDLEYAAVVGLENPVHKEPTEDPNTFMYSDIAFTTIVPSVASGHEGRFAVLQQAIPKSGRGLAIIQGIVRVKVIFTTGTEKWADITDGSTATLTAAASGSAWILWREGSGTGTVWAVCLIGGGTRRYAFPVTLAVTSGTAGDTGDATTKCGYKYDVTDSISGASMGTAVDPIVSPHKWVRPTVGYMIAATFGYAHRNSTGALVIGWINEVADQEACN